MFTPDSEPDAGLSLAAGDLRVEKLSKRFRFALTTGDSDSDSDPAGGLMDSGDPDDDDEVDDEPDTARQPAREVWALRDLSFSVEAGTALGVLGANGSGKTTLLRVLGRTIPPTAGRVLIGGRTIPLLRTITRFLDRTKTGRENVLVIADLCGVSRESAERRAPEIAAFAEVEEMIDVEMSRYSAGFQQRLAMATILHLDHEVTLADGLPLAGDAWFRARCVDRLQQMAREDRTLLLASDDPDLIRNMCSRAVHLRKGTVVDEGPVEKVIRGYTADLPPTRDDRVRAKMAKVTKRAEKAEARLAHAEGRLDRARKRVTGGRDTPPASLSMSELELVGQDGRSASILRGDDSASLRTVVDVPVAPARILCELQVKSPDRVVAFADKQASKTRDAGEHVVTVQLSPDLLAAKELVFTVRMSVQEHRGGRTAWRAHRSIRVPVESPIAWSDRDSGPEVQIMITTEATRLQ